MTVILLSWRCRGLKYYFLLLYIPIRKAIGIPHSGFAMTANSSTPLSIVLARGVSLPSAVMNAIKNTPIQTARKIPTAHNPRFQFPVISFLKVRTHPLPTVFCYPRFF